MPTVRHSRTIAASKQELWDVICDPHHLPRWWPRVQRVEDVEDDAFTEVMKTAKGKVVRADFRLLEADQSAGSLKWEQLVEDTPFGHLLKSAHTEVQLAPIAAPAAGDAQSLEAERVAPQATEVTIELRQKLNGFFPRFGGFMVSRAALRTIEEALDGLERISG